MSKLPSQPSLGVRAQAMLRSLLERDFPSELERTLKYLPEGTCSKEPLQALGDDLGVFQLETQIERIHYSWLHRHLTQYGRKIEATEMEMLLASLSTKQRGGLATLLGLPAPNYELASYLKPLFLAPLYEATGIADILPMYCLPESPELTFMWLSKTELQDLLNLAGLFALAAEYGLVIDKKTLEALNTHLSAKQKAAFKYCLQTHKKLGLKPKNFLKGWNLAKDSLNDFLSLEGIYMMGAIIAESGPDYLWHMMRKLDTGRADLLAKAIATKISSQARESILHELLELHTRQTP